MVNVIMLSVVVLNVVVTDKHSSATSSVCLTLSVCDFWIGTHKGDSENYLRPKKISKTFNAKNL